MPKLTVIENATTKEFLFTGKRRLDLLLTEMGIYLPHPCGGHGLCEKCKVIIDGSPELSCRYFVDGDITVTIPDSTEISSVTGAVEDGSITEDLALCLDIGTTTLALALVSIDDKKIIKTVTSANPQSVFGADVISRIEHCKKNGPLELQRILIEKLNCMINELFAIYGIKKVPSLFVSGNTAMLHLFFGVDCSEMGVAPYTPSFLGAKACDTEGLGIVGTDKVISLPCISSFVGADIVAGLNYIGLPSSEKYHMFVDLGTNAEIVLFSSQKILATSAAAGPCFEGANISFGMSTSDGAISAYSRDRGCSTINNAPPKGICATGLIDIIAELARTGEIDESGYMKTNVFKITDDISISRADIREFQLAKSAVISAILCLMNDADISFDDIEKVYVAGGFSSGINVKNATFLGLLPTELSGSFTPVNNSSLLGTVKFAFEGNDLESLVKKAETIDISKDPFFSEQFFENMGF